MSRGAYLLSLGLVPYAEAFALQRSLAGAVSQRRDPGDRHLPRAPAGRHGRAAHRDRARAHIPEGAEVEIAETDRGGKSTFHGPGQLVCYPILDLGNHGKDVKRYVRDLEEALLRTLAAFEIEGERIEGLTGVWLMRTAVPGGPLAAAEDGTGTHGRPTERPAAERWRSRAPPGGSRTGQGRRRGRSRRSVSTSRGG